MSLVGRVAAYLALLLVTFLMCFPLIWALSTSLKPAKDVMATPPRVIPKEVTFANYRNLITGKEQYYRADQSYVPSTAAPQHFVSWFGNSVLVSLGSTLISIVISTLAAYSITRFRYAGRWLIPYFSLLGYMIPSIILFSLMSGFSGLAGGFMSLLLVRGVMELQRFLHGDLRFLLFSEVPPSVYERHGFRVLPAEHQRFLPSVAMATGEAPLSVEEAEPLQAYF